MIGRILGSLQHRLDQEEAEWKSLNEHRHEIRPTVFQCIFSSFGQFPIQWGIGFGVTFICLSIFILLVPTDIWVQFRFSKGEISDYGAYIYALWAVQAAVAALIYPIVVSFVAMLLGKSSHDSRAALHIYLYDSAAIFAGLSALGLVALMGVQFLALPYVERDVLIGWASIDACWFLLNLAFTIHFLLRTFHFIQPNRRAQTIKRYVLNVIWPNEARVYLAQLIFRTAVEEKSIPGPSYGDATGSHASVVTGAYGLGKGVAEVVFIHRGEYRLTDVRFKLLKLGIESWMKRANRRDAVLPKSTSVAHMRSSPIIEFPLDVFKDIRGPFDICVTHGAYRTTAFERTLIRWSFSFSRAAREEIEVSVDDVIGEMQQEAISAIRSGDSDAFERAHRRMMALYEGLIQVSRVRSSDGSFQSLLMLHSGIGLFARKVIDGWGAQLFDLFRASLLPTEIKLEYTRTLIHAPGQLYQLSVEMRDRDVCTQFMWWNHRLFLLLEQWWQEAAAAQNTEKNDCCNFFELRPPMRDGHKRAIIEFIHAWELLKNYKIPMGRNEAKNLAWPDFQFSTAQFETHLLTTLELLFAAVWRGDRVSTELLNDSLILWFGQLMPRFSGKGSYLFDQENQVTTDLVRLGSWALVQDRLGADAVRQWGAPDASAVVERAIENLWRDVCCIAIYQYFVWGSSCANAATNQTLRLICALMEGKATSDNSGTGRTERPYNSFDELMTAIVRQRIGNDEGMTFYGSQLAKTIEQINSWKAPFVAPGRIYSSWYADGWDTLNFGQLIALMVEIRAGWNASNPFGQLLAVWAQGSPAKVDALRAMLKTWRDSLAETSFDECQEIFEGVAKLRGNSLAFGDARQMLSEAIDQMLKKLTESYDAALQEAEIDPTKINALGMALSAKAFSKEDGAFPLSVFSKVGRSAVADDSFVERSFKIQGLKKGEYTVRPLAQIPFDPDNWFTDAACQYVAAAVLARTAESLAAQRVSVTGAEGYWLEVKQFAIDARSSGLKPILLLENPVIPDWISEWSIRQYDDQAPNVPSDLVVSRNAAIHDEAYLFSFNEIPVYTAPLESGASLLTVLEAFDSLTFLSRNDGQMVSVEPIPPADRTGQLDVTISWKMLVQTRQTPARWIVYRETD
jgi:hypothetical protein